jgi:hypothetical protein
VAIAWARGQACLVINGFSGVPSSRFRKNDDVRLCCWNRQCQLVTLQW